MDNRNLELPGRQLMIIIRYRCRISFFIIIILSDSFNNTGAFTGDKKPSDKSDGFQK